MGSFKINYYLQPENKNKQCQILCSISWDGLRLKTTVNLTVLSDNWDDTKHMVKRQATDSVRINNKLNEIRFKLNEYYTQYKYENKKSPAKKDVKEIIRSIIEDRPPKKKKMPKTEKPKTLLECYKIFIKDNKDGTRLSGGKKLQPRTIVSMNTTLNHLEIFFKSTRVHYELDDIGDNFYSAFTKYMTKNNLGNNTQGKCIKNIKTCLHYTKHLGYHNNSVFVRALTVHNKESDLPVLTETELESLEGLTKLSSRHEQARDLFLMQIYTGLRLGDLFNLKPANVDYNNQIISLNMIKTGEYVQIPISKTLEILLKKYNVLPPKISSQNHNYRIKEVCKIAGIDSPTLQIKFIGNNRIEEVFPKYQLISSHTARRTCITLLLKMKVLPEMVMKITGHSSRKSFQKYVKISLPEAVIAVKNAWDTKQSKYLINTDEII